MYIVNIATDLLSLAFILLHCFTVQSSALDRACPDGTATTYNSLQNFFNIRSRKQFFIRFCRRLVVIFGNTSWRFLCSLPRTTRSKLRNTSETHDIRRRSLGSSDAKLVVQYLCAGRRLSFLPSSFSPSHSLKLAHVCSVETGKATTVDPIRSRSRWCVRSMFQYRVSV